MHRFVVLVLAVPLLAGCLQDVPSDDSLTDVDDVEPALGADAVESNNTAPEARLVLSETEGDTPLNVTFGLDGSDADGDALSWSLDVDGDAVADYNGTDLPAAPFHIYEEGGSWNVTFIVDDGNDTAVEVATVNVTVPPPPVPPEPVVFEGEALVPDPAAFTTTECALPLLGGPDGVTGNAHAVPSQTYGWNYTLEPAEGFLIKWYGDGYLGTSDPIGTVPKGTTEVQICANLPTVAGSYVMTLTPPGM